MAKSGMRWRRTWERSWALWGLAAVFGVAGVLAEKWKAPFWWVSLALAIMAALGGLLLPRMTERAKAQDAQADRVGRAVRTGNERGGLDLVRDVEDAELGVHPAHVTVDYIRRDKERDLREALAAGRPTLVLGHSMAGKTRMAAQVIREEYGDRPIFIPTPPDGIAQLAADALPEGAVVWLNDLERYLIGDGLRVEWLDRMRRLDNVIVATLRAKEHEKLQPTKDVRPPQAELLERFTLVRLRPDPAEQQRIASHIDIASTRAGITRYGLAEYVGGGYLAVERFETGESVHPLGAASVRAATDWRRIGLTTVPVASLNALAPMYLPERYRYDPGEDIGTAMAWATELIDGTVRLLEPAEGGAFRAFDYILDYLSRVAAPIPDHTWREAVSSTPADQAPLVGYRAYQAGQLARAADLWQLAIDSGHADYAPQAALNLGVLRREQGNPAGAEQAWQLAIDSGHVDVAPKAALNLRRLRQAGCLDDPRE